MNKIDMYTMVEMVKCALIINSPKEKYICSRIKRINKYYVSKL